MSTTVAPQNAYHDLHSALTPYNRVIEDYYTQKGYAHLKFAEISTKSVYFYLNIQIISR